MASIYGLGQEKNGDSISEAVCKEFSDTDGKIRINTPEKAKRYLELLQERGYKPAIGEMPVRNDGRNKETQA